MATTFPSNILPSTVQFGLRSNTQVFQSPFTSSTQTVRMPGAAWYGRAVFDDMEADEARELISFLTTLQGMDGRFYFADLSHREPRGSMASSTLTPRIRGGSQTGSTLAIDGLPANLSAAFVKGDYIAFDTSQGRELHMVTATANANSSGQSTLSITPNIRTSPADNAVVAYRTVVNGGIDNTDTSCIVRLVNDDNSWSVRSPVITTVTINFVEAFS